MGAARAPAVSRVMGGAKERNKNRKTYLGEMTFGEGFCICCQVQIHWYYIHKCK